MSGITEFITSFSGLGYLFSWLPSPLDTLCGALIGIVLILGVVKLIVAIIGVFI